MRCFETVHKQFGSFEGTHFYFFFNEMMSSFWVQAWIEENNRRKKKPDSIKVSRLDLQ